MGIQIITIGTLFPVCGICTPSITNYSPITKTVFETIKESLRFTRTYRPITHVKVVGGACPGQRNTVGVGSACSEVGG